MIAKIGDRVPTVFLNGIATITATDGHGHYKSDSGLLWTLNGDTGLLEPYTTDIDYITFEADVSRKYANKTGYDHGYELNTSFATEQHTARSFIERVIKEGWPYTMKHAKRSPEETGAAARGVTTPKHTENFISLQLLTFDDDSKAPGVVRWWLNDPFFRRYGWLFVESVNSEPGAEKGHPTILLDRPIEDAELAKECIEAFLYHYPRLDQLKNIDRTIYNAVGATVHNLGNVCHFEAFEEHILEPYRQAQREKQEAIEAERQRRQAAYEAAKAAGREASDDAKEAFLAGYLNWLFDKVANARKGDNRNTKIYWAGRCIAGVEATPWVRPYLHLLRDASSRIVEAADANGYLEQYANGNAAEVERIFERGRAAGGETLDEPVQTGAKYQVGDTVTAVVKGVTKAVGRVKAVKWRLEQGTWRAYYELEAVS